MTKTITIAGQTFSISEPYAVGHTLTENEARALNQVRAENIRNNMAKAVKEAFESGDQDKIFAVGKAVDEYANAYDFSGLRAKGESTRTLDPVEREARKIAKAVVADKLAEKGLSIRVVPEGYTEDSWKEKIEANVAKFAADENIVKAAKKAVEAAKKSKSALAETLSLD